LVGLYEARAGQAALRRGFQNLHDGATSPTGSTMSDTVVHTSHDQTIIDGFAITLRDTAGDAPRTANLTLKAQSTPIT
jgi:hypothetical protein